MTTLTMEGVLALAPDESSAKAARGLLGANGWPLLGASDAAVWGECQGSGSKPYQTQVDLAGPAFRCSCPSRKFPCKHGLALLLIRVQRPESFGATEPPAWVAEWLASRSEKAQKKEEKQQAALEKANAPADPAAAAATAAKREAQRWQRITDASLDLQRWLADQLARGLGALNGESLKAWHTMAARLVDAQAPGLAQRVRDAAAGVHDGADWPERTLQRLGRLQLACEALQRRDALDAELQAELRNLVGWPWDKLEVIAASPRVDDDWRVLGVIAEERDEKLVERRVWLHGERSGRRAWLLDHAFGGRGFEQSFVAGSRVRAGLHFYPGTASLRALVADGAALADGAAPWPRPALADEWRGMAQRVAANPWTWLHPIVVDAAVLARDGAAWVLHVEGQVLPASLSDAEGWALLAAQGGAPLRLIGEWDGRALRPLTAIDAAVDGAHAVVWQCGAAA